MSQMILVTIEGTQSSEIISILENLHVAILEQGTSDSCMSIMIEAAIDHHVLNELHSFCDSRSLSIECHAQDFSDQVPTHFLAIATPRIITAAFLKEVILFLKQAQVETLRFENFMSGQLKAIRLALRASSPFQTQEFKMGLMEISNRFKIDLALLDEAQFLRSKKLIVFDMDSTLIQAEVIDEMAQVHGVGDKVKLITERAMNGELNFDQSLEARLALLKGLKRTQVESIYQNIKLTPGTEKFMKIIKKHGYKTAIVSGGFQFFADQFKTRLSMDYAFANSLDWEGDALSGQVKHPILNAQKKADILEKLARDENLSLDQVVAVGDGANDLPMLLKAGLGIAFHAKEKVRREARHHMSYGPMTTILYFLGITGNHFDETL